MNAYIWFGTLKSTKFLNEKIIHAQTIMQNIFGTNLQNYTYN